MYSRRLHFPVDMKDSVFLFGPRGTGKTAWLKHNFPGALYFDCLDQRILNQFLGDPSQLSNQIPANYQDWIIIDEVQKIPALLNEVHRLIESQQYRFILTGSSARALRKKGVNLLAGRALTFHMHPLVAAELGHDFNLPHALAYGLLPATFKTYDPELYLSSYVQTYLKEEVQQEALTRNISTFAKFLTVASFSQGEVLNYTSIAREVGTTRQTIVNFFDILEDLLIASRLPVFNRHAKRDMIAHNKFYYFDVGVFRSIRPIGPLDLSSEQLGPALETLFLQQARAVNHYDRLGYEFYFWRTRQQQEVDFVLYGKRGLHAFEIKHKRTVQAKDLRHLRQFQKDYPMAKCKLLYGGERCYQDQGIDIIPYQTALTELPKYLLS